MYYVCLLYTSLEQVVDELTDALKARHIERLQGGSCTIELGFVLSDLLTNCERVSDHCSNIAVCIVRINHSDFDTHGYLQNIKDTHETNYEREFEAFEKKYALPAAKDVYKRQGQAFPLSCCGGPLPGKGK